MPRIDPKETEDDIIAEAIERFTKAAQGQS